VCNPFDLVFFFSSRRRHTRFSRDWSSDVCSSDLGIFDYDQKVERLEEVTRELEDPNVWNDPERAQSLGKERSSLEQVVNTLQRLAQGLDDVEGLVELARSEERRVGKEYKT